MYSTSAGRALDSSRAIGVTPDKAADLIFEFVAVVGFLGAVCNPTPIATNGDSRKTDTYMLMWSPQTRPLCFSLI